MQYWSMAVDYPFNSGGRPHNSWPAFIPVTFEMLILIASFGAFLGMLFLNGLPRPNHPVFNVPRFARASQDRFFFCIESADPQFDEIATAAFLAATEPPGGVVEVPFEWRPPRTRRSRAAEICRRLAFFKARACRANSRQRQKRKRLASPRRAGGASRLGCACALIVLAGCQQQMADQPSYKPLDASSFFTNGQSARQLVAGTVARGHLEIDSHFYTGRKPGANRQAETTRTATPLPLGKNVGGPTAALDESQFVDAFPFPITLEVLKPRARPFPDLLRRVP